MNQIVNVAAPVASPARSTAMAEGPPRERDPRRPLTGATLPATTRGNRAALAVARAMAGIADRLFARRYGHRAVVLETIAAVPGMVAAMLLHLHSLRSLENDYGWIHTLLDEAENERMHLMTFAAIAKPVWWERAFIIVAQGTFFGGYLILYIAAPGFAHRMVGYLEEQAIVSYTAYLAELAARGGGDRPAPEVALKYWDLPPHATLRDVITIIRNDECRHRDINHALSDQLASGHKKQPGSQSDSGI